MSGIAGIIHFDGKPVEPGLIEKMTSAMAHRGPDGISHLVKGSIVFGYCQFRTTPESLEEAQPLVNEDASLMLVMDGRVDNRDELKNKLRGRGAVLRDNSDAELVLRAYEYWGEDSPKHIIGDYVYLIWDGWHHGLFGARDALGSRHFYYHQWEGGFAFASEIKGLLALDKIELRLNKNILVGCLLEQYRGGDAVGTFYEDIQRLPAGHFIWVSPNARRIRRYWNPQDLSLASHLKTLDDCREAFLNQFREALKCRLRSIKPVGAMLSGGLDSSSIAGLIRKEFQNALVQPLQTFSLTRSDRENCEDWKSQQEMLKEGWFEHTVITPDLPQNLYCDYFQAIAKDDEPWERVNRLFWWLVIRSAHEKGCTVLLEGNFGDSHFYYLDTSAQLISSRREFTKLPSLIGAYRQHGQNTLSILWNILRFITPDKMRGIYRGLRDLVAPIRNLVKDPIDLLVTLENFITDPLVHQVVSEHQARLASKHALVQHGDDQYYHAQVFFQGDHAMANEMNGNVGQSMGVEFRGPFADQRLVELSISMPLAWKHSIPWYKHGLRLAMAGILPEAVRWRRSIAIHPGLQFYEALYAALSQRNGRGLMFPKNIIKIKELFELDLMAIRKSFDEYIRRGLDRAYEGFDLYCIHLTFTITALVVAWLNDESRHSMLNK